ncbi:hypothetical protein BU25DRAFT_435383 [Macroventuria anomochaeta]|uniref:Uncharacterized protein n=1 Tax=Macroventuria anomochaeta TaxID=301207 RepID=A0ACB6RKR3_9PLEO|nr:uncharacterized protein BU25DRAFT_435383 [Macroventuria anomochaeta]KAF2621562.1 hypothetical protein BU25DRAFT_435383 [Macroventuria anomochaeta]
MHLPDYGGLYQSLHDNNVLEQWPAFPVIPIFLETHDDRAAPKTYGTTPTTPTTPETLTHSQPAPSSLARLTTPDKSSLQHSPTTTIQTSSARSSVWPIPEPQPEIQYQEPRRPTLNFFPTERPRIRLGGMSSLQIAQFNEKTPINANDPGLGIIHGLSKPPSIEVTPPINEKADASFNFAQRIEERLWRYSASGNILKRWLLEILSWLFSAICMGAVIGVLIYLQGNSLSRWTIQEKTHLTLNAYISILSKMAGAALILPVSEALGQLKWSWFLEHSKQIWDFEIFDNASRGPWGSLLLLIRTKGRALAALGALIMLCALALDPFFQQVVDFPERSALYNTSGTIPRVVNYSPSFIPEFKYGYEVSQLNQDLGPSIRQFLYGNGTHPIEFGNGTRPDIPLSCPTSNCTWPEYETLAVCSKCVSIDVSEVLTFACLNTTIDWTASFTGEIADTTTPNGTACGYFINATSTAPILMSGYLFNESNVGHEIGEALLVRTMPLTKFLTKDQLYGAGSIKFKDVRNPLLDALIVSATNGADSVYQHESPVVHECVLSWCVQTIKSSYEGGKYTEEVLSRYENTTAGPSPWESFPIPEDEGGGFDTFYMQDISITPATSDQDRPASTVFNTTYGTNNITAYTLINVFDDFFPSYYTVASAADTPILRYKNYDGTGASTRELAYSSWQEPNDIVFHVSRLAVAMTNGIRSDVNSNEMLHGTAYRMETYVEVRWQWLALPLGVLFVSLIFLAATITKSALERERVGVWKTSAYATLLYGLPDEVQKKITRSSSTGTPRTKAKEMKVKLQPNQGWRISEAIFSPFSPKPRLNQPPPGWI